MEMPSIPAEIRARIIEAAEQLYSASDRERMPSVAEVRVIARTDMNSTAIVVREWKRQQTARPAPVAVTVPEPVQQAMNEALAVVWMTGQELANSSLRTAEQQWQLERAEISDDLRGASDEVERLDAALKVALGQIAQEQARCSDEIQARKTTEANLAECREVLARIQERAEQEEARAIELTQHLADCRKETERSYVENESIRGELSAARASHHDEMKQLKAITAEQIEKVKIELATVKAKADVELATVKAKAEASEQLHQEQKHNSAQEATKQAERLAALQVERDAAIKAQSDARENAAHLGGQLEAVQAQNVALMERIGAEKPGAKR